MDNWKAQEIFEQFGEPRTEVVRTICGFKPGPSAPKYLVESARMIRPEFLDEEIMLVDFWESFPFDKPTPQDQIGIPFSYCAPEVIFDSIVSEYSEIWALGCVIAEVRGGRPLFLRWSGGPDEILRQFVQTLGQLPDPWWEAWGNRYAYFDENGKPNTLWSDGSPRSIEYPLEEIIADFGADDEEEESRFGEAFLKPIGAQVTDKEASKLTHLLSRILRWEPKERLPLEGVFKHSVFE
jgi:serine/threonine-protein kinase SRPK3